MRPIQRKTHLGTAGGGGPEDEEFSAQDIVDFSPVYRCCHIFSVLVNDERPFIFITRLFYNSG